MLATLSLATTARRPGSAKSVVGRELCTDTVVSVGSSASQVGLALTGRRGGTGGTFTKASVAILGRSTVSCAGSAGKGSGGGIGVVYVSVKACAVSCERV